MGLFSKKDKDKKKEESAAAPPSQQQPQQQQQQQEHPSLVNPTPTAPPPSKENNLSTDPAQQKSQNSWTDSTYQSYTGSSNSEEPQIRRQQEQRLQGHPPGTTVTTTTTTTTTVTTVSSDGRVHTQTFPYDPNTDPPVRTSETTSNADSSRARSIGGSSNTNSVSNPNSSTNIPTTQNQTQSQATGNAGLAPGPHGPERPEVQRTISPARKTTPQELESDTHFNIIPPTPQGSQSSKGPRASDGNRIIPPRSERRVSPRTSFGAGNAIEPEPGFMPDGPLSPGPPMRSEKRNSIDRGLNVAPLKTSGSPSRPNSRPPSQGYGQPLEQTYSGRSSYEAPPHPPPKDDNNWHQRKQQESEYAAPQMHPAQRDHSPYNTSNNSSNYIPVGGNSYDPLSPVSPTNPNPHSRSHTPNAAYSRPGPTVNSPSQSQFDLPPTSAQAMHAPHSDAASMTGSTTTISSNGQQQPHKSHAYRQSFSQTMKGIQGASDVIRGTVNSNIARVTREKEEAERQRAIREKGLADYRSSGLQEQMRGWGGRVPVGRQQDGSTRLRKRSLSRNGVHGSEGPGGLEPLEERSISSQ